MIMDYLVNWGMRAAFVNEGKHSWFPYPGGYLEDNGAINQATAAWHPEADEQSEQTYQTANIALQRYLSANSTANCVRFAPSPRYPGNVGNASTGIPPNKIGCSDITIFRISYLYILDQCLLVY